MLYEGRIIDEREADRIYTQYFEILSQKKKGGGSSAAQVKDNSESASVVNNEGSHTSNLSGNQMDSELVQSSAQWKKDETMLLQYIILNVADQRDTLVENF